MVPPDAVLPDLADGFSRFELRGVPTVWDGERCAENEDPKLNRQQTKEVMEDYEGRIGGIENSVNAYRMVASCLDGLPEKFRRRVWDSELKSLGRYLEQLVQGQAVNLTEFLGDRVDEGISYEKDRIEERIESIRTLLETSLYLEDIDEAASRLRHLLANDDALLEDDRYWETVRSAENFYTFVRESRQKLRRISSLSRAGSFVRHLNGTLYPLTTTARIEIDERDVIRIIPDQFAEAISGINSTHIRECVICKTIFWAGRRDSMCCSSSCADKRRKRQHRARYKERLLAEWQKEQEERDGKARSDKATSSQAQQRRRRN